ncbi:LLM class flavin-dependent oxidoreductase [uncultured Albimonas sp.]|uniref:LLM class flavin-dependent oxidoreductase n=1 Tax=uncultured Albimonas sp. TaxID=1331701 RepID=UPI0030EF71B9|tara:strand:+ start:694 stop:1797 length:1104 start_codon:yes stop_codon:yes gene_type:complete
MQFGLFNLLTYRDNPGGIAGVIEDSRTMVRLAEQAGFHAAWFAEHHFTNYSLSVSPLMMASHMAAATSTIKVGPAVVVLPLHNPLRVAQEIALLDQMSGGRALLGLGSGYQPYEFDRFKIDIKAKNEVFLEYFEVLRQAMEEGHVDFQGKHFQAPPTVFAMRPASGKLPPLFLTTQAPEVLKAVGPHEPTAFIAGAWSGKADALVKSKDGLRANWLASGLPEATMRIAMQQYIAVVRSHAEALEAAERARSYARMVWALRQPKLDLTAKGEIVPLELPDEPSLEDLARNMVIGDAHSVAERIVDDIRTLGPVHYNCFFQFGDMPIRMAAASLERFGAEVIPLVEKEVGPLSDLGDAGEAPRAIARAG